MKKIEEEILKFRNERDWKQFHTPGNLAKSISIEAGELLECFHWNDEYKKEQVEDELADVFNNCVLLAHELGIDLESISLNKIEKNKLKYPIEKSKGSSKKYTEFDI